MPLPLTDVEAETENVTCQGHRASEARTSQVLLILEPGPDPHFPGNLLDFLVFWFLHLGNWVTTCTTEMF